MNNTRKVSCPFGLLNIGGLVETTPIKNSNTVVGAEAVIPLFCHESYKIKPTFNRNLDQSFAIMDLGDDINTGKYYQKKFRRMVLWDFGDGHTEEGYSVEHYYSKPGRYKITCTFYDINRRAWKNSYHIYVAVKELIPNKLSFDDNYTKSEVLCSKIERIARLETTLSLNCQEDLQVKALRIFSENEEDSNYQEINRNFKNLPDEIMKFSKKYWTFLENQQQLLYHSDKIFSESLLPQDLYTPNYITLYGKFVYNNKNEDEPIDVKIYQVIPYKNIDDNLKTIRVLNPNCSLDDLLSHDGDINDFNDKFTRVIEIKQVHLQEQLPSDVSVIGKRAFVDIFYKNDYLTTEEHDNVFTFTFDIDDKNITKELESSDNYLNINPLGLSVKVIPNNVNDVKIGVSLDGFIRELTDEDDWSEKDWYIDPYLWNSLVKDIELDFYVFPYIEYNSDEEVIEGFDISVRDGDVSDFVTNNKMYYMPKDFKIDVTVWENLDTKYEGEGSKWDNERGIESVKDTEWLRRVPFALNDYFSYNFDVSVGDEKHINFVINKGMLINPDSLSIPTEKMIREDIKEIVQTYMNHPMFEEADSIKKFFEIILSGQNLLNYTLTKSNNFLDDHANIRTCYLSSLISTLKMMGEDILEYEKGGFEGVNDLRDFVRLLTINHSELVGHVIGEQLDITVQLDRIGKNVSDQIKLTDKLKLRKDDNVHTKGKIQTLTREGKSYDYKALHKDGVDVIVQDRYTHDTKIVNFRLVKDEELDENGCISIGDYRDTWGWNLLLPDRFDKCILKLNENEQYKKDNGIYLYSNNEIERTKQVMRQMIDGYYAFYILNPNVETRRVGNFLDENTISSRIDDHKDWYADWGVSHDIMMKILRDNGQYKHTNYVLEDDNTQTYRLIRLMDDDSLCGIIDDEIANVTNTVYIDNSVSYEHFIEGIIKVYGVVCEETTQYLELTLDANVSDEYESIPIRTIEDQVLFKVKMGADGHITPTKQEYDLVVNGYKGRLTVSLCGKIEKVKGKLKGFIWDASIELFELNNEDES